MSSRLPAFALVALALLACSDGDSGGSPGTGPQGADTLRLVGGPLVCDSCAQAAFRIAGPGVEQISGAAFIRRTAPARILSGTTTLHRVIEDDLVLLDATIGFADSVPVGDYDLKLQLIGAGGQAQERMIRGALRVTRAWRADSGTGDADYGLIHVSVTTTGSDPDTNFVARLVSGGGVEVGAGSSATYRTPAGEGTLILDDVAPNCRVRSGSMRSILVAANATTEVVFEVTCEAYAIIRVTAHIDGGDPVPGITVECDDGDCAGGVLRFNGDAARLQVGAGQHNIALRLPFNCSAIGATEASVTTEPGSNSDVAFNVSCRPVTGTLRVTVQTTGAEPVGWFGIAYGYVGCSVYWFDCDGGTGEAVRGVNAFRVDPDRYEVWLYSLPPGCILNGESRTAVSVVAGETADLLFEVTCS
jgi:hypothetical protein